MKIQNRKHQKGQALLEGALVLPLLFSFTFGIIDAGRVLYAMNTVNNIAREEVRAFATDPGLSSNAAQTGKENGREEVIDRVRERIRHRISRTGGIDPEGTTVTVQVPADLQKNPVQVEISNSVKLISTLLFPPQFREFKFTAKSSSFVENPSPVISNPELLNLISPDVDGDGVANSLDADPYHRPAGCSTDIKLCSHVDACKVYRDDVSCSAANGISADDACKYSRSRARCSEASYEVACKYGGTKYCHNTHDICTINGNKNICTRSVYCAAVGEGCSEREVQCLVEKQCSKQESCTFDSTLCTAQELCNFGNDNCNLCQAFGNTSAENHQRYCDVKK